MKICLVILLAPLILISCDSYDTNRMNIDQFVNESLHDFYLVDDVYFPQDTLVMRQFQLSDSATKKKLLLQFRDDSLFLSNYNFGPWYGKWFCDFGSASATFAKNELIINAHFSPRKYMCKNENTWQKIEYQLIDSTDKTVTYVKTLDTTNCISNSVFRNICSHLGRGGRDFTKQVGEEIRSDIQLR